MPDPLNAVVDISHHNGNIDLQQARVLESSVLFIKLRRAALIQCM
jgi:GH25 family lysozyme M1 (1,4-beta-N-acetylmuramidase)